MSLKNLLLTASEWVGTLLVNALGIVIALAIIYMIGIVFVHLRRSL